MTAEAACWVSHILEFKCYQKNYHHDSERNNGYNDAYKGENSSVVPQKMLISFQVIT